MKSIYELVTSSAIVLEIPIGKNVPVIIDKQGKSKKEVKDFSRKIMVIDQDREEKLQEAMEDGKVGEFLIYITYPKEKNHSPTRREIKSLARIITQFIIKS